MNNIILGVLLLVVLISCQESLVTTKELVKGPIARSSANRPSGLIARNTEYNKVGSLLTPEDVFEEDDLDYTYRTVYGEVRNQGDAEIKAVCQVIYNRWSSDNHGASLKEVVLQRKQFSVWNYDDPNRPLLLDALISTKPSFTRVKTICREVFATRLKGIDLSQGINHYYHPNAMKLKCLKKSKKLRCIKWHRPPPKWASTYYHKKKIGHGIFFVK